MKLKCTSAALVGIASPALSVGNVLTTPPRREVRAPGCGVPTLAIAVGRIDATTKTDISVAVGAEPPFRPDPHRSYTTRKEGA